MKSDTENNKTYIRVIRSYQDIWRTAKDDDLTICVARDYGNFSGIEKLIEKFLEKNPTDHSLALSLGCGTGKDLAKIREFYSSSVLFGVDTSRDALLKARNKLSGSDAHLVCASMSHLPIRESLRFDMVIAGQSLDLAFGKDYVKMLLMEATKHSSIECRFYMTFYGRSKDNLILSKCNPIGKLLDELGWKVIHGEFYRDNELPLAEGIFWVARRSKQSRDQR